MFIKFFLSWSSFSALLLLQPIDIPWALALYSLSFTKQTKTPSLRSLCANMLMSGTVLKGALLAFITKQCCCIRTVLQLYINPSPDKPCKCKTNRLSQHHSSASYVLFLNSRSHVPQSGKCFQAWFLTFIHCRLISLFQIGLVSWICSYLVLA